MVFYACVERIAPIAGRCSIQFLNGKAIKDSMYLEDPLIKEKEAGSFHLVIQSPNQVPVSQVITERSLEHLTRLAHDLLYRSEIQVRGNRLAVNATSRNANIIG